MRLNSVVIVVLGSNVAFGFKWPWDKDLSSSSVIASLSSTGVAPVTANSASTSWSGASTATFSDGGAYAPQQTSCPDGSIIREATAISPQEQQYIEARQLITTEALKNFLTNVSNLTNFDSDAFFSKASRNISIALAFSGGGYRAMLAGAGELLAMDNRSSDLNSHGLGGLLQSSTYILGLSGGSWLLGTLVLNNWITVDQVMDQNLNLWKLDSTIFNPNGFNIIKTTSYYNLIRQAVNAKQNAGFATSVTDVWGRALSYQFFDPDKTYNAGENVTWSSITNLDSFQKHEMPFPIIIADGRNPGSVIINLNSTVFEFTPYELGSWDPSVRAFADLKYLGTASNNGSSLRQCITNFDNAGFILGTLSSYFNQMILRLRLNDNINWAARKLLEFVLGSFSDNDADIAAYEPNPFYNSNFGTLQSISTNKTLHLADGGEDKQNIPLYPFIQPKRKVDVLFAYDNSADTHQHWPNGSSLVYTFKRQFGTQGKGTPFPFVPNVEEFLSKGLAQRPTFFGCSAANLTGLASYHNNTVNATDIPLVIYMPNSRYSFDANISTYKMDIEPSDMSGIVSNGFSVSTRGNFTADNMWNKCVGCAIIRREQERSGAEQSDECKQCFANYCWTGGIKDSAELEISLPSSESTPSATTLASKTTLAARSTSGQSQTAQSNTSLRKNAADTNSPVHRGFLVLMLLLLQ